MTFFGESPEKWISDKISWTMYQKAAVYCIKCLHLSFTYLLAPGEMHTTVVINALSIGGSCFWAIPGVLLDN